MTIWRLASTHGVIAAASVILCWMLNHTLQHESRRVYDLEQKVLDGELKDLEKGGDEGDEKDWLPVPPFPRQAVAAARRAIPAFSYGLNEGANRMIALGVSAYLCFAIALVARVGLEEPARQRLIAPALATAAAAGASAAVVFIRESTLDDPGGDFFGMLCWSALIIALLVLPPLFGTVVAARRLVLDAPTREAGSAPGVWRTLLGWALVTAAGLTAVLELA